MKTLNALLCSFFLIFAQPLVWALPTGQNVVGGSATFNQLPGQLTVNSSDRAVIEWQQFSIQLGELTQFVQPGANSAVLNRVVGGNLSEIYGTLQSNGQVYLVNPQGIIVGSTGVIDTNGFIASTLDVSNAQFLAGGAMDFVGESTAAVTNLGSISALSGDVFLIAREVENIGTISAPQGTAALLAGQEVYLTADGDASVRVGTTQVPVDDVAEGIKNSGVIEAAKAQLEAAGGNIYAMAINNSGTVRASGTSVQDGVVYFTAGGDDIENSGSVSAVNADGSGGVIAVHGGVGSTVSVTGSGSFDASGATGGRVTLEGMHIGLFDQARVLAEGDSAGGEVLVGGDRLGENPDIMNADAVYVGKDAKLSTSATVDGDGGKLIVFSKNSTRVYGDLASRGAGQGAGGLVETSGGWFEITTNPDVSAPSGNGGTWLIDPDDITIVSGSGNTNVTGSNPFTSTGGVANLGVDLITTALGSGNVDIVTASGSIFVSVAINYTGVGGNILTFDASTDVYINENISSTNATHIVFKADENIVIAAGKQVASGGGNITYHADDNTDNSGNFTNNGTMNAGGGVITITGVSYLHNGLLNSAGGDVNITVSKNMDMAASSMVGTSGGDFTVIANSSASATGDFKGFSMGTGASIDTGVGAVSITAIGGDSGVADYQNGIHLTGGSSISTTTGNITLTGTGGNGSMYNAGVYMTGSGTSVNTADGTITIDGTAGNGLGGEDSGVYITDAAEVAATGTGSVDITGVGSSSALSGNHGIYITTSNAKVAANGGTLSLNGTGNGTAGNGVYLGSNAIIENTGSGTIDITGSGTGDGIHVLMASGVIGSASHAGAVILDGTTSGSPTYNGINYSSDSVQGVAGQVIKFYADDPYLNVNITGVADVLFAPHTAGTDIFAGTGATGSGLVLDGTFLGMVGTTGKLMIGTPTHTADVTLSPFTMTQDTEVYTSAGAFVADTIDGGFNFSVDGASSVLFNGVIGGTTAPNSLTVANSGAVTAGSALTVNSAVSITASSLNIGDVHTAGSYSVDVTNIALSSNTTIDTSTAGGAIDLHNSHVNGAFSLNLMSGLGSMSLLGNVGNVTSLTQLNISGQSAVSQVGSWDVGLLNITTTDDVSLTNAANNIGQFVISANNIDIENSTAIDLGATTAAGDLTVQVASGGITDSGVLSVTGTAYFNGDSVTLDVAGNTFSSVGFGLTGDASVTGGSAPIVLATSSIGGDLTVDTSTGGSNITSTADVSVGGTADFNAGVGDVTLSGTGSSYGLFEAVGSSVSFSSNTDVTIGSVSASTLDVSTTGDISDDLGSITVDSLFLDAGTAGNIALAGTHSITTGLDISNANDVLIAAPYNIEGLSIAAGGSITVSSVTGDLVVTSVSTSGAGSYIVLDAARTLDISGATISSNGGGISLSANLTEASTGTFRGIVFSSGSVDAAGGDISLVGIGGDTSFGNEGVFIENGDLLTSGNGSISIIGGSGTVSDSGIQIDGGNIGGATSGDILISDTSVAGSNFGLTYTTTFGDASFSGMISVMTDALELGSMTDFYAPGGSVYLIPANDSTVVNLGDGAPSTGLSLTDTELATINSTVGILHIGRPTSTGGMQVYDITPQQDLHLIAGSDTINFNGTVNMGSSTLAIDSVGSVTQDPGSAIIAPMGVEFLGVASVMLTESSNDIGAVAGWVHDLDLVTSGNITIDFVNGSAPGIFAYEKLDITSSGGDIIIERTAAANQGLTLTTFDTAMDLSAEAGDILLGANWDIQTPDSKYVLFTYDDTNDLSAIEGQHRFGIIEEGIPIDVDGEFVLSSFGDEEESFIFYAMGSASQDFDNFPIGEDTVADAEGEGDGTAGSGDDTIFDDPFEESTGGVGTDDLLDLTDVEVDNDVDLGGDDLGGDDLGGDGDLGGDADFGGEEPGDGGAVGEEGGADDGAATGNEDEGAGSGDDQAAGDEEAGSDEQGAGDDEEAAGDEEESSDEESSEDEESTDTGTGGAGENAEPADEAVIEPGGTVGLGSGGINEAPPPPQLSSSLTPQVRTELRSAW